MGIELVDCVRFTHRKPLWLLTFTVGMRSTVCPAVRAAPIVSFVLICEILEAVQSRLARPAQMELVGLVILAQNPCCHSQQTCLVEAAQRHVVQCIKRILSTFSFELRHAL